MSDWSARKMGGVLGIYALLLQLGAGRTRQISTTPQPNRQPYLLPSSKTPKFNFYVPTGDFFPDVPFVSFFPWRTADRSKTHHYNVRKIANWRRLCAFRHLEYDYQV